MRGRLVWRGVRGASDQLRVPSSQLGACRSLPKRGGAVEGGETPPGAHNFVACRKEGTVCFAFRQDKYSRGVREGGAEKQEDQGIEMPSLWARRMMDFVIAEPSSFLITTERRGQGLPFRSANLIMFTRVWVATASPSSLSTLLHSSIQTLDKRVSLPIFTFHLSPGAGVAATGVAGSLACRSLPPSPPLPVPALPQPPPLPPPHP